MFKTYVIIVATMSMQRVPSQPTVRTDTLLFPTFFIPGRFAHWNQVQQALSAAPDIDKRTVIVNGRENVRDISVPLARLILSVMLDKGASDIIGTHFQESTQDNFTAAAFDLNLFGGKYAYIEYRDLISYDVFSQPRALPQLALELASIKIPR